jgi:hypothetical protein
MTTRNLRAASALGVALLGCTDGGPDSAVPALASADASDSSVDGGGAASTSMGPPALQQVRVAEWYPAAPAYDVCLAVHGSDSGASPVLAGRFGGAAASDADPASAAFPNASAYGAVAVALYDALPVPLGSIDCPPPAGAAYVALPLAHPGTSLTLAVTQPADPTQGPGVTALPDDTSYPAGALAAGQLAVRFVNALAPPRALVDLNLETDAGITPLFVGLPWMGVSNVNEAVAAEPRDAGDAMDSGDGAAYPYVWSPYVPPIPFVDESGYVSLPSTWEGVRLHAVQSDGGTELAVSEPLSFAPGAVLTFVLTARPSATRGPESGVFVQCVDVATGSAPAGCTLASP